MIHLRTGQVPGWRLLALRLVEIDSLLLPYFLSTSFSYIAWIVPIPQLMFATSGKQNQDPPTYLVRKYATNARIIAIGST